MNRQQLMLATIVGALLLLVGWSYFYLDGRRDSARAAGEDLAACRTLAGRIAELRTRPAVAGTQELGDAEMARRIEQAAGVAHLSQENIERIDPEPVRRIGETNYRQVPTRVRLKRVNLEQAVTFLHALGSEAGSPLRVEQVRFSSPPGEETGDRWTMESTLCYTVYSPRE
jgi:hypothetical protein